MTEKERWLEKAEDFFQDGDFKAMRACAREILAKNIEDIDALSLKAEASIYLEDLEIARKFARNLKQRGGNNIRALFVDALLQGYDFKLKEEMFILQKIFHLGKEYYLHHFEIGVFERALRRLSDVYFFLSYPKESVATLFFLSAYLKDKSKKAELYSKALFITNFYLLDQDVSFTLHQGYQKFFDKITPYTHLKEYADPERKLRIGYISGDFRRHAVANFVTPFLRDYEKHDFTIFCYMLGEEDEITQNFRRFAVVWKNLATFKAEEIANTIYQDRIDILVDFSGHTLYSALPALSYKPAPIIIEALGYRNTTGLKAVDYFLSDGISTPREEKNYFTEEIIRLLNSHFCYIPFYLENISSAGKIPPCEHNKYITFASFNQFNKISAKNFLLWQKILDKLPNSRLVLKSKIASLPIGRKRMQEKLKAYGFDLRRIELRPYSENYLEEYKDIDIALDTFPYTGGLTTCEALIMGVPVITLKGKSHGERFSASILHAANLSELIAKDEETYIEKVLALANTRAKLKYYHQNLREQLLKAPLMQGVNYIREIETNYRTIWRKYCNKVNENKQKIGDDFE